MLVARLIVCTDEFLRHFQRFSHFVVSITCRSSTFLHGSNSTLPARPKVLMPRSVYLPELFHQQAPRLSPTAGGWLLSVLSQIPIRIILANLAQLSRPFGLREAIRIAPAVDHSWRPPDARGPAHRRTTVGNSKLDSCRYLDTLRHWNHKEKVSRMKHSRRDFIKISSGALGAMAVPSEAVKAPCRRRPQLLRCFREIGIRHSGGGRGRRT